VRAADVRTSTSAAAARKLRSQLAPGRAAFNRGEFFAAHELWEDVWRNLAGEHRTFTQGLIQIAAGLHHLQRGRPRPAASVLGRGVEKLARGGAVQSIATLVRGVARVRAALEAGGDAAVEAGQIRF
jgi:predicted metal-dependent hydrolase